MIIPVLNQSPKNTLRDKNKGIRSPIILHDNVTPNKHGKVEEFLANMVGRN